MAEAPATPTEAVRLFEQARAEFKQAYADVPAAALRYLPEGDDYALGGLIVHIANTLENYVKLVARMRSEGFQETRSAAGSGETPEMLEALKHGFDGPELAQHWSRMDKAHAALVGEVQALGDADFQRAAPVVFGAATEPTPTTPAAIMSWMIDHYRDHVGQARDMLAEWQADEQPT